MHCVIDRKCHILYIEYIRRKGETFMIPVEVLCQLFNLVLLVGILIFLVIVARALNTYTRKNAQKLAKILPFPRRHDAQK